MKAFALVGASVLRKAPFGDKRLVVLSEYGPTPEPPLAALLARLEPVDIVIVQGFRTAELPTLEVHRPSSGRLPRWPSNRNIIAVVSDETVETALPCFHPDDVGGIADFLLARAKPRARPRA